MLLDVRCVVQASDQLGEGPCWSPVEGRLYWFDIKGRRLAWYEPGTDDRGAFDLPLRASAAAPRASGGLLIATERGLATVDTDAGTVELVQELALEEGFRSNDGKIDLHGRFWWSVMDDNGGERPGAVYRTGPDWKTYKVLTGIHIPNTISSSPDGETMYMVDSSRQTIFAHSMLHMDRVREFAHTRGAAHTPDGSAVDADGYIWNAQWGGWRVVRYAPDGSVDRIVRMPIEQPTSCAFGGPDLSTLFVTSAWDELSPERRMQQPLAGGLFAVETGVRGLPLPLFQG
jgi:sugar lactone lactonase YvrE